MTTGPAEASGQQSAPLRIAFVAGVTPDKWSRIWKQRVPNIRLEVTQVPDHHQLAVLHEGTADLSFVRLPVEREGLSVIPLYREVPVAVVPVDHVLGAFDEVSMADLADEHMLRPGGSLTPKQAVETVAAGTGIVVLPRSVARLYNRKDVTSRPVTDADDSQIGLAWLTSATDARIEKFIGIVRGRSEHSSRDSQTTPPERGRGRRGRR